jgi:hypothetical protein
MPLDNALNGSQPDSRSFKVFSAVEALEDAEEFIHIFHVKANPIVFHIKHDFVLISVAASYFDLRRVAFAREFNRV